MPTPAFKLITLTDPLEDAIQSAAFNQCYFKEFTHTLRDGMLYRCAPSTNVPAKIRSMGDHVAPQDSGLELASSTDLRRDVFDYLTSQAPLPACRFCLGSSGIEREHRMLTRDEVANPHKVAYRPNMLVIG
jgi:hypothetical protein